MEEARVHVRRGWTRASRSWAHGEKRVCVTLPYEKKPNNIHVVQLLGAACAFAILLI